MNQVVVIDAKRSPVGRIPGELNFIEETLLLSRVFASMKKTWEKTSVDEAVTGSSFPIERDNLCRKALQNIDGLEAVPAYTLSKTCASSDEALRTAYSRIKAGEAQTMLVGGCEKVSNSPYALHFMKKNVKKAMRKQLPKYCEIFHEIEENDMAYINEMLSRRHQISREQQDDFTLNSIRKAYVAEKKGLFRTEIVPIEYQIGETTYRLVRDEWLGNDRPEQLIKEAAPIFLEDGMITQYNVAPICECAAAMLLADSAYAMRQKIPILAVLKDAITIGVNREERGNTMVSCVDRLLKRNHFMASDVDLFEINESFASQAIHTMRQLGIEERKVNVNGGNLALGYPIGATGLRMSISLIYEMIRKGVRWGISVMCSGGNMANAALFENPFPIVKEDDIGIRKDRIVHDKLSII